MAARILVTGATGNIGRAVVQELADRGVEFRVFTRDANKASALGVEAFEGDFGEAGSLEAAMRGVDAIFLNSSQHPDMARLQGNVSAAAADAGVRHIVKVSGGTSVTGEDKASWAGRAHHQVERMIEDAGIGYTFLRPAYFMQNLLALAEPIRAGKLPVPLPDQRIAVVDARDVGAAAAAILVSPEEHRGRTYDLTGPESLSFADIAERLSAVLGQNVQHVAPPIDAAVESLRAKGAPDWLQQHVAEIMEIFAQDPSVAVVTDSVEQITGRPPRTLEGFLADHATAFGVERVS
jgi:NAD(P)H dehydrogenase (quinone)